MRLIRHAFLLGTLLAMTGCNSLRPAQVAKDPNPLPDGPDYVRWMPRDFQPTPLPTAPGATAQQAPATRPTPDKADQLTRPRQDWWTEFDSPELNALIDTALTNNYDLRVAVARIEQAEKQALITDGARAPSIDFFSGVESRGPSLGVGTATSRDDWNSRRTYQFGLRVNYEIDLWGRMGYESRSALEQARASVFNREVVALTLISETVTTYLQYLSLTERIAIAEKTRELAQEVARAITRRLQRGDASKIEQQQQQVAIAMMDNNLASLRMQKERALTKLSVYLGKPPGTIHIQATDLRGVRLPRVAPGLPSELLCRRPDIRRAEAQLAAASADVAAARAGLLPSVALTGQFGQGSFNLSELLSPQSMLYSLAGNLVGNVFDDERRENRVVQARARNRELLEQYANTVLAALRDVEDALAGIRMTVLQEQALTEALDRNRNLLEMSQKIFKLGALDLLSYLDLQRNVYLAQDAEASARFEQIRSMVDLYKALGGGVAEKGDPCAPPPKANTPKPAVSSAPAATTDKPQADSAAHAPPPAVSPAAAPAPTAAAPTEAAATDTPPGNASQSTGRALPDPTTVQRARPLPPRPEGRANMSEAARAAAAQAEREAQDAAADHAK